jgi:hypothetical protein
MKCPYAERLDCPYNDTPTNCSDCEVYKGFIKDTRLCATLKKLGAKKCHVVKEVDCKDCDMSRPDYATLRIGDKRCLRYKNKAECLWNIECDTCSYFGIKGKKDDDGKLRWDLLPLKPIEDTIKVLMFGANKYGPNNWRKVDDGLNRYYSACMRHLVAHKSGELNDPETGLSHLAHAMCNLVFMQELQNS